MIANGVLRMKKKSSAPRTTSPYVLMTHKMWPEKSSHNMKPNSPRGMQPSKRLKTSSVYFVQANHLPPVDRQPRWRLRYPPGLFGDNSCPQALTSLLSDVLIQGRILPRCQTVLPWQGNLQRARPFPPPVVQDSNPRSSMGIRAVSDLDLQHEAGARYQQLGRRRPSNPGHAVHPKRPSRLLPRSLPRAH